MKSFNCTFCKEPIDIQMVQQGGMHLNCFFQYSHDEKEFYCICFNGGRVITDTTDGLEDWAKSLEGSELLIVGKKKMTQFEYDNLKESTGF